MPAYQLAVVVDDARQGVTDVIRGADLLPSAARQALLYRALGLAPPRWWHLPLVSGQMAADWPSVMVTRASARTASRACARNASSA
jgi:glutamyl/glutaminyl-tRNA synthetase